MKTKKKLNDCRMLMIYQSQGRYHEKKQKKGEEKLFGAKVRKSIL